MPCVRRATSCWAVRARYHMGNLLVGDYLEEGAAALGVMLIEDAANS